MNCLPRKFDGVANSFLTAEITEITEKYHLKSLGYLCDIRGFRGESLVIAPPSKLVSLPFFLTHWFSERLDSRLLPRE
jgi:hypothetical protein